MKQQIQNITKAGRFNSSNLIDTLGESSSELEPLNRLATYICDTPVSLVNLLDDNFQYTISKFGDWRGQTLPKEETVCQFTIHEEEILVIPDTLNDQRTSAIQEIADNTSVRFYAGVPIKSPSGNRIGAFCVIGDRPQELSDDQQQALIDLGKEVEARIKLVKEKKAVESQRDRLQEASAFLENSTDIRWVLEPVTFKILKAEGTEHILECSDSDIIGKNLLDLIEQVNIQNHIKQWTNKQTDRSKLGVPVQLATAECNELWLDLTFTRYNGKLLATGRDITKQHQAEEQLKHSLQEKEVLLSEVHHRVKNNLAVVSGLLQLERFQTEDENIISVLRNSESRIMSIGKIHELLYQTDNFSNVQLEQYLQELVAYLQESYPLDSKKVEIDLKVSDLSINVNQALPLGLIANELIANAIKHAFTEKEKGTITVLVMDKEPGTVSVEISDDGKGLDIDPTNLRENGNLGFTLVSTLVKQLKADLEIETDHGTTFRFKFQKNDNKGSVSAL